MLKELYQEAELYWATNQDLPAGLKHRIREELGGSLVLHHKVGHGLMLNTPDHGFVKTTIERVMDLAQGADLRAQILTVEPNGHKIDVTGHLNDVDVLHAHEGDVEFHFLPVK